MENAKSSKGYIPARFIMIRGFKLGNKLADKKEHNKSGGWGGEPDIIPQEGAGLGPHVPTAPKGCTVWKKPSRRLQDSTSVRTQSNSAESYAEPWVLPLSFPLGRGGYSN